MYLYKAVVPHFISPKIIKSGNLPIVFPFLP
jgi:hypothetical protein